MEKIFKNWKWYQKFMVYIFITLLIFIFIMPQIIPQKEYIEKSVWEKLKINDYNRGYTSMVGTSKSYVIFIDGISNKYFIINYYHERRSDYFPTLLKNNLQISALVNKKECEDKEFGTEKNPIPILDYKENGKRAFGIEKYNWNVKRYLVFEKFGIYKYSVIILVTFILLFIVEKLFS